MIAVAAFNFVRNKIECRLRDTGVKAETGSKPKIQDHSFDTQGTDKS